MIILPLHCPTTHTQPTTGATAPSNVQHPQTTGPYQPYIPPNVTSSITHHWCSHTDLNTGHAEQAREHQQKVNTSLRRTPKDQIHKYFACDIILQLFQNSSKAKLVVTVS